jgi:single-strand DNA-binding protein
MIHKNEVTLIGNIGKDAELKTFENGDQILRFSMATNREYKDGNGQTQSAVTWHNIVLRGKQIKYAKDRLKKGMLVYVQGEIRNRPYSKDNPAVITEIVGTAYVLDLSRQEASVPSSAEASAESDDLPF